MRKIVALLSLLMLALLSGCSPQQTHFGITAPADTWIKIALGVFVLSTGIFVWLLVLLVRWIRVSLRGRE
jgi:hypothetical protein